MPYNPKGWLYGTLNNLIKLNYREQYARKDKTVQFSEEEFYFQYSPSFPEKLEDDEIAKQLICIIESELNDTEQELAEYIYKDNMSYKEISLKLGISQAAVRQKNFRICHKVRKAAKKLNII